MLIERHDEIQAYRKILSLSLGMDTQKRLSYCVALSLDQTMWAQLLNLSNRANMMESKIFSLLISISKTIFYLNSLIEIFSRQWYAWVRSRTHQKAKSDIFRWQKSWFIQNLLNIYVAMQISHNYSLSLDNHRMCQRFESLLLFEGSLMPFSLGFSKFLFGYDVCFRFWILYITKKLLFLAPTNCINVKYNIWKFANS